MGWGEAVRDAQIAVHAWESCRDFAADLLRYVTWTVFLWLEDYTVVQWGFSEGMEKIWDPRTGCLVGWKFPVRELLISSPACHCSG